LSSSPPVIPEFPLSRRERGSGGEDPKEQDECCAFLTVLVSLVLVASSRGRADLGI